MTCFEPFDFEENHTDALASLSEVTARTRIAAWHTANRFARVHGRRLQRERSRAEREGDTARAAELKRAVDAERARADGFAHQSAREQIPAVPVGEGQAAFTGRVVKQGRGAPGLRVELHDGAGKTVARACSDEIGAFALAHEPRAELSIQVRQPGGKVLAEKRDLPELVEGRACYLEISVDGEIPDCSWDEDDEPEPREDDGGETDTVEVPQLRGMDEKAAVARLRETGLRTGQRSRAPEEADVKPGQVLSSEPPADTAVPPGSRVNLVIAARRGRPEQPRRPAIPDLTGLPLDQARRELLRRKLSVGEIELETDAERAGQVLAHTPTSGEPAPEDAKVKLVVATGSEAADFATAAEMLTLQAGGSLADLSSQELRRRLEKAGITSIRAMKEAAAGPQAGFAKALATRPGRGTAKLQRAALEIVQRFEGD